MTASRLGLGLLATGVLPGLVSAQPAPVGDFQVDPVINHRAEWLTQGPDGRVWIGDDLGLWIYDGIARVPFRGAEGSKEPRPSGPVRSMLLDSEGRLWVGQWRALVLIDPRTDAVLSVYHHDPDDPTTLLDGDVTALLETKAGRIWAGSLRWSDPSAGGLTLLSEDGVEFERFQHDPADPTSLSDSRIRSLAEDREGRVWVGTWAGLNRRSGAGFVRYLPDSSDPESLAYGDVKALHLDASGSLWVVTIGGGLDRFDPTRDAFDHIPTPGSGLLTGIVEDEDGRLWLGTLDGGLLTFAPGDTRLRQVDLQPVAANDVRVGGLTITRDRVLWVSIFTSEVGGANMLRLDLDAPRMSIRATDNTLSVHAADDGDIWGGSDDRLWLWNRDRDSLTEYSCHGARAAGIDTFVSDVLTAPDGTVWASFWDPSLGLCRLDPGGSQFERVLPDATQLTAISDAAWWGDRLWLAAGGFLRAFDPATLEIETVYPTEQEWRASESVRVNRLAVDGAGDLWMAAYDGSLVRRDAETAEMEAFGPVVTGTTTRDRGVVTHMAPATRHTLWVSTGGYGLCAFEREMGACVRVWTVDDGLTADYITSAVQDGRGRVWVATRTGLAEVDPEEDLVRTLPRPAGAASAEFREGAAVVAPNGDVLFGSGVGVVAFDPNESLGNQRPADVRISRVEVAGGASGEEALRPERLGVEDGPLELASDLDDVVFEYVGLHFGEPGANRYSYRLDGLDDRWREVGTERRARFTNLSPGDYRFRVRAASQNGVWGDEVDFAFRVLAPWWERPWALGLWFLLGSATLAVVLAVRRRQEMMLHALAVERAEASRLKEVSDARSRLFANLSHEYRSPLGLILGQIAAVRGGVEDVEDRLEMAERQTLQLQRLTDELLDLSRAESGVLRLDRRQVDLVSLVRRVVADFESAAEEIGIALEVTTVEESIRVECDADRIAQVVGNLVSNALKHTGPDTRVCVGVATVAEAEPPEAVITVEDSGAGISPEALPHVFDRFYRATVDADGDSRGTGIGLAFVLELVELHGGSVQVSSEMGKGTRFEVLIPTGFSPGEEPISNASGRGSSSGLGDELNGDGGEATPEVPTLLVIEDHADMRNFLRQELGDLYRIEEAIDGASGVARAIELVPDLVLTDVTMPVLDGYGVVQALRGDPCTSHVPIIMLTGRATEESQVAGLDSGADDYLTKPLSTRVLRARVENLLRIRTMLRERFAEVLWLRPSEVARELPREQLFLESVVEAIEARIGEQDFSVEELASAVGMSRSQLHRKLKALVNQSPGSLIRSMRLKRAADLVAETGHSLGRIAYMTGFADQAHFTRSFGKQFGCTPSEYRARESG